MGQCGRASNNIYESVSSLYCYKLWFAPEEKEAHNGEKLKRRISHKCTKNTKERNFYLRKTIDQNKALTLDHFTLFDFPLCPDHLGRSSLMSIIRIP